MYAVGKLEIASRDTEKGPSANYLSSGGSSSSGGDTISSTTSGSSSDTTSGTMTEPGLVTILKVRWEIPTCERILRATACSVYFTCYYYIVGRYQVRYGVSDVPGIVLILMTLHLSAYESCTSAIIPRSSRYCRQSSQCWWCCVAAFARLLLTTIRVYVHTITLML